MSLSQTGIKREALFLEVGSYSKWVPASLGGAFNRLTKSELESSPSKVRGEEFKERNIRCLEDRSSRKEG